MAINENFIRWFKEITIDDIPLVGGKNASLGEMYQSLQASNVIVPNGFAITARAYYRILEQAGTLTELKQIVTGLNPDNVSELAEIAAQARQLIFQSAIPIEIEQQIFAAYDLLQQQYGEQLTVAVRSSATAEDLPNASFAGQQDTYLNVKGRKDLITACKHCFASLFTDRAIHYRSVKGFDHFKVGLSITVMKMVRSDLAASGVMFTLDTESGFDDVVFITAAYGLGENIVQGAVDPDEFYVHKTTFKQGFKAVLRRNMGAKQIKMCYADEGSEQRVKNIPTPPEQQNQFCLSDEDVLTLADYAMTIEKHYSDKAGKARPMDIEWAKDGLDGQLYIVQARPETVQSQLQTTVVEYYRLKQEAQAMVTGHAVGSQIAHGRAHIIRNISELKSFKPGEVLIADMTTPDWEPVMKMASAIVTNKGGRTCHAAIIARELGVPAVVGCGDASEKIDNGQQLTVSCAEGDIAKVYLGQLEFEIEKIDLKDLPRPKTKIMLNLGNPELAFKTRFLPNDGVGLARMEFIIAQHIKAHPMALLYPEKVADQQERQQIQQLIRPYKTGADYFIQKLSEGVATIAAAFYPKPVVVRMSDFKTNEYASLLGGQWFEQEEANPMIGFRGASRYTHPNYTEGFALECAAMKRVREQMGLNNVILMIPFCRREREAEKVIKRMEALGLKRGENGLKIYMMCEIPNNVIRIDGFAKYFDGISIGSNDLTQLTLGVDRDSEIIAEDFDERDPGVKAMIEMAVQGAKRNGIHSGLCGQAPSDYPEMAAFLVEIGIDSMSLTPDTVLKTLKYISRLEKQQIQGALPEYNYK